MNYNVLENLIKSPESYFIIEANEIYYNRNGYENTRKVAFIALPPKIQEMLHEVTMDTITYKQVCDLENCYTDCNLYIFPKYPPFQRGQMLLKDAVSAESIDIKDCGVLYRLLADGKVESSYGVMKILKAEVVDGNRSGKNGDG